MQRSVTSFLTAKYPCLKTVYVIMLMIMFYSGNVFAGDAVLSWYPSTDTNLAGYKVYYGTATRVYNKVITVGLTNTPSAPKYMVSNLADGTAFYFALTVYDTAGNESGFSNEVSKTTPTSTPDTTPPVISSITAGNITGSGSGAGITWSTNEAATSEVQYGTTTDYGSSTKLDSTLVTSHSVSLSGLSTSTTYHFRVLSQDAAGNITASGDNTIITSAAPVGSVPPMDITDFKLGSSNTMGGGCGMIFPEDHDGGNPPRWPMDFVLLTAVMVWFGLIRKVKRSIYRLNNGSNCVDIRDNEGYLLKGLGGLNS